MDQQQAAAIIRDLEDRYAETFNGRNVAAFAALFTEQATIVTEWGDVVVGREVFAEGLARAFTVLPKALRIETRPSHAIALTENVMVCHGIAHKYSPEGEVQLVYTRVLLREGNAWRIAANQVAEISRRPDPRATP